MRDIETRADIDDLLRDFYAAGFVDDLLGGVFIDVAHMDLEAHLPVIGAFWEKVLLHRDVYRGNAMRVHQDLDEKTPLTPAHFERWLLLWSAAVDRRFAGPVADAAKHHAAMIAAAMQRRLGHQDASSTDKDSAAEIRLQPDRAAVRPPRSQPANRTS